jgi:hypothetical protein
VVDSLVLRGLENIGSGSEIIALVVLVHEGQVLTLEVLFVYF